MKKQIIALAFLLTVIVSCEITPEPINYGVDGCHYCSMTIVEKQHAAEYITNKGKAFKFDSIECMLNSLKEVDRTKIALYLVDDYGNPGELIDASAATYLISKNMPSPMGAFLSAFGNEETGKVVRAEQGGQLFSWVALQKRF